MGLEGRCSNGRRSDLQTTWLTKALSSDTLQNGTLQHVIPGSALLARLLYQRC